MIAVVSPQNLFNGPSRVLHCSVSIVNCTFCIEIQRRSKA